MQQKMQGTWILYTQAAESLVKQGDYLQAEKILRSGISALQGYLDDASRAKNEMHRSLSEILSLRSLVVPHTLSLDNTLTVEDALLIDKSLALLAPRWTVEILASLSNGPRRTTQLLRDLKGVSAKTLCQRLRKLGELDLIHRTTFPEVPPRVEYTLTERGRALGNVLHQLKNLGETL